MDKKQGRILLAVDGSDQSLEAVRYVGEVISCEQNEVVLFNVRTEVPESFWDLEKNPEMHSKIIQISAWASQQKKIINEFMEKALLILNNAGFSKQKVKVKIQKKKKGIARDIIAESNGDYSAVVLGRTGLSRVKDMIIGSVANKIVGKTKDISIAIVGGKPETEKILVAFDGSEGALKCVDFTGSMFGHSDMEIMLCHVIRPLSIFQKEYGQIFSEDEEAVWLKSNMEKIGPAMEKARNVLMDKGVGSDRISSQVITDVPSRALGIVEKARADNFGTIMIGRRGLSRVEEFFIGRVSKKVINMTKKRTIWIVK